MDRLGVSRQRTKQVLATLAESTGRLKVSRAGQPEEMSKLLELETLSADIWTKIRLWRSLEAADELRARLEAVDFANLVARAEQQLEALEEHRLNAARNALTNDRT